MFLCLYDGSKNLIARKQLAGTRWLVVDDGFANAETVDLIATASGRGPWIMATYDDDYHLLNYCRPIGQLGDVSYVYHGDAIRLNPGKIEITLVPKLQPAPVAPA